MKPRSFWMTALGIGMLQLGSALPQAHAADPSTLPRFGSLPDEAFTESERKAVVAWTLALPELRSKLDGRRHRLLKATSDHPKGAAGEYRRATVIVRNYDDRLVHFVYVDLASGAVEIVDTDGVVQPTPEEIEEAMTLVKRDPVLATFVADPQLTLVGGFSNRSKYPDDPCARDLCLEFHFTKPSFDPELVRGVIVNLTRQAVAHHDFQRTTDPAHPSRMTESQGDQQ